MSALHSSYRKGFRGPSPLITPIQEKQLRQLLAEHWEYAVRPEEFNLLRTGGDENDFLVDAYITWMTVFVAEVAVGFHRQRAAVFVAEPARDGGDVHAGFNAARREKMAQIVVRQF